MLIENVKCQKQHAYPSVSIITKQAFFNYLDDETDNIGQNINYKDLKDIKKATIEFLKNIGEDIDK
jgi:hypothetical protein